ncbi:MAG: formylmethanofuran dehydrogenase subunit C [Chitinophagales bacterium]|nr:formylmethanofuran dehydrogenase subunit C [Hyphomicrobiales bacterium]
MSGLTLTLKSPPAQRLNFAQITPEKLKGLSEREIAAISVGVIREPVLLGDVFNIVMGDVDNIRIAGSSDRVDHVGWGMSAGAITVEGPTGAYSGCNLSGGSLTIKGDAGPWAGSGQSGGKIEITGHAGDSAGGALPGAASGMRGGVLIVRGKVGARAGDRMRRGLLMIEAKAGDYLGASMIAGTIVAMQGAGVYPGYLMNRGTIILDGGAGELPPGFMDCGPQELVVMRLMAKAIAPLNKQLAGRFAAPVRRYAGDMAAFGGGEIVAFEALR